MRNTLIAVLFIGIVLSFAGGFYAGKVYSFVPPIEGATNLETGKPGDVDFSLFWDAWRVVQKDYVGTEPLDFQTMVYGAISGMVKSLGDPYTSFMTAQDTQIFLEDIEGSFSGVGMEIGIRDDKLQVIAPLEGTPAEAAGLRAGDHIVKIDKDIFTADLSVDEAVARIRGPEGSTVTLNILRDGWAEPRDFEIQRAVIAIPSLRYETKEGNIAYVKMFQFSEKLRSDFRDVENQIIANGSRNIIIDLRNNPGGFLHIAVDMAGWFLERGEVVVIEDYGEGAEQEKHRARGNGRFSHYNVAVLINEGSASASEILAGALRDNNGILLIGGQSFGKGSVQEVKELKDKSSLKVTVANWLTPNGTLITGEGLVPDVEVELTEEDFEAGRDPQLDRAIEVLKNL